MSNFSASIQAILDTSKIPNQISQIERYQVRLRNFYLDTSGLPSQIQARLDGHRFRISLDGLRTSNIENQMMQSGNRAGNAFSQTLVNRINSQLSSGGLTASIARVTAQYQKLGASGHANLQQIENDIRELNSLQAAMNTSQSNGQLVANYQAFNNVLLRVRNTLTSVSAQVNSYPNLFGNSTMMSSLQVGTLDNKMQLWLEKNQKAAKRFGDEINRLRTKLNTLYNNGGISASEGAEISNRFAEINTEATKLGLTGNSVFASFKKGFQSIARYIGISTIIYQGIAALRSMYNNVAEVDKQMTELKKVTDETADSYERFLDKASGKAKEIGTTVSGLISSTADFARLGYSFGEAQELAEVANIYAVVGDEVESVDTATQSLVSTMAAFGDDITALDVIDKFNEVGNNFAISSGGIGDALQRSASSLDAANNSLDQSIALITAANTIVQDPESVGTAFKTISMRIRGAKSELEEAGLETDGMVESTAKLREQILAISGVDIMLDENTFKSTYDIMDELSAKWKDLTDIERATITEMIAGKRQGNVVSSLMSNFDIAREALKTSQGSSGSATEEHEKWLESIEAKTNRLKASFEELSMTVMKTDFLKGLIDSGTATLSVLSAIIDKFGLLGIALPITGLVTFIKNFD